MTYSIHKPVGPQNPGAGVNMCVRASSKGLMDLSVTGKFCMVRQRSLHIQPQVMDKLPTSESAGPKSMHTT